MNQSTALHTILNNEDIIPISYIKAQNCIQATSDTMNGFAALKSMLTTVHPKFTRTQPDPNPPVYSTFNNLHLYEQSLQSFYQKHYLYDGHRRTEIQKAEQFLIGLDTSDYDNAKNRLVVQIDNVKHHGGQLPPQYGLDNITGTLLNMVPYTTGVTVNVLQRSGQQSRTPNKNLKPQNTRQYSNIQCGACKIFGHATRDCRNVGKILAVMEFQKSNQKYCQKILQTHTNKNDPERRAKIIRSLQTLDAIPTPDNFDDIYLNADIDDTIDHTVNITNAAMPSLDDTDPSPEE